MSIFVLGGNSPRNKPWAHQLSSALRQVTPQIEVHEYAHWGNDGSDIDLEQEMQSLAPKLALAGGYAFVTKSVGTVLAAKGIHEGLFAPKFCVFMGLPLKMIEREAIPFLSWLSEARCPLSFIQNDADPLGSFADVREYLEASSLHSYKIAELPGDTHDYLDFNQLKKLITPYL